MKRLSAKHLSTLGLIAFLTGFSLMAYELVAARLLAPTIGSSIYVWTSVIGVIIAALSLGYWLGGRLADARQKPTDVVILCLLSGLGVVFTLILHTPTLAWLAESFDDVRWQGLVASTLLFAPTSFLLGCISPYLAKLNIRSLDTAGTSVANLSALNSIGGIVGTFMTGFIFFGYLGSKETLIIVVAFLVLSSWLLVPKQFFVRRLIVSVVLIALMLLPSPVARGTVARIDTPSAHYEISKMTYNDAQVYGLQTGPSTIQSAVYADGRNELVFWYTQYAEKIIEQYRPERVLILGGGAFTLVGTLADKLPNATIDVVEIDPELEAISKKYFHYEDRSNVNLIFADARSFVNTADTAYDVILVDVYGDSYVPFSLLTKEFGTHVDRILAHDGTVVVNAIAGNGAACQELLGAIDSVYRPFLQNAYWNTQTGTQMARANYILVYTQTGAPLADMQPFVTAPSVYTDNFMPAERLHDQCKQEAA